jgi:hypothetical protein
MIVFIPPSSSSRISSDETETVGGTYGGEVAKILETAARGGGGER